MNIIAALSILGVATAAAANASADRHALRHFRSLQYKCAADVKECEDGSFVSRDPGSDCEFLPCPEEIAPTTCLVNNLEVEVGQEYTAPDGCNTCTCTETGKSACTKKLCEPCSTCDGDDGSTYCAGEAFLSGDGCNTCRCTENGASACTFMACPDPADPTPRVCTMEAMECDDGSFVGRDPYNGCDFSPCPEDSDVESFSTSGAISVSVGLSAIVAFGASLGAAMF